MKSTAPDGRQKRKKSRILGICSACAWQPAPSSRGSRTFLLEHRLELLVVHDEVELLGGSVGADLDRALVRWIRTRSWSRVAAAHLLEVVGLFGRASRPRIFSVYSDVSFCPSR